MATFTGTNNNDTLTGTEFDDVLDGLDGNDRLEGYSGSDTYYGGAGDDYLLDFDGTHADYLYGGDGNDYLATTSNVGGGSILDGGAGVDMISYANETLGVTIDLAANTVTRGGISLGDMILNFEQAQGSDLGGDTLYGTSGVNFLDGRGGDDYLYGRGGDDTFVGSSGDDHIFGGTGWDIARYDFDHTNGGTQGINVNLATGVVTDAFGDTDMLYSIAEVWGTVFADYITGTNGSNTFDGFDGNDDLYGGGGDDTLHGSGGRDHLFGEAGRDIITGGQGNDTLKGGTGWDELHGGDGRDKLFGGSGVDYLYGDGGSDIYYGGGGDDYILDFDGAHGDTLFGGAGNDYLGTTSNVGGGSSFDGGTGIDMISYANDTLGITIDLAANTVTRGGVAIGDTIVSFEQVQGSQGGDTLYGTADNNVLDGRGSDDYLYGRDGTDQLIGLSGNDYIDGGNGWDIARYDYDETNGGTQGINANLGTGFVVDTFGDTDILIDIEEISGSVFDDIMRGNAGNNTLIGNDGNDVLIGKAGSDFLAGGTGNDRLTGGKGQDNLHGGEGADTFVFVAVTDSLNSPKADQIQDFQSGLDYIDLSTLGGGLTFIGSAGFSGTGSEVRAVSSGGDVIIRTDVDGDGAADMKIVLDGVTSVVFGDFIL